MFQPKMPCYAKMGAHEEVKILIKLVKSLGQKKKNLMQIIRFHSLTPNLWVLEHITYVLSAINACIEGQLVYLIEIGSVPFLMMYSNLSCRLMETFTYAKHVERN